MSDAMTQIPADVRERVAPDWSEVRERANMLRAVLRENGFEHLRSALVGQHSDAVCYGQWERHKALLRDLLDALDAALRSEAQGEGWQVTEPARDIVRREMPETRATVREAIRAAIHSETPGVTRCRICCERPAALTLCTECADEALWRSIYDQWLAEEATNARFRAIVHEWRCGMCGHWSPRRCRARCQRCGAVRGYGYRDREAVEERTVITYPTDRSESDAD